MVYEVSIHLGEPAAPSLFMPTAASLLELFVLASLPAMPLLPVRTMACPSQERRMRVVSNKRGSRGIWPRVPPHRPPSGYFTDVVAVRACTLLRAV